MALAAYAAGVKWIECRVPTELHLPDAPRAFAAGVLTSVGFMSLVIGVLWVAAVYQPTGLGSFDALGHGFVYMLAVAVREEILYRALVFRLCARVVGTWGGLLVSALYFGVSHASNPGATFVRCSMTLSPARGLPLHSPQRDNFGYRSVCTWDGISPKARYSARRFRDTISAQA